jgi:hypothetical protein
MTKLIVSKGLVGDLRQLIEEARQDVACAVNSSLVILDWQMGQRTRQDILKGQRAEYGEQSVYALSRKLSAEFGSGFTDKNLRRMIQFAEVFPDEQIVATASRQSGVTLREDPSNAR